MDYIKLLPSLVVFTEIADRGSFTAAAKHLGLSKSAVSQHLTRLEAQVGAQLLSRNTRGMSLTALGEKLYARGEMMRDQADLAFQELASAEDMPSGSFSFTIPHSLEKDFAIPAVAQLCEEFPKLEPHMVVTDSALDIIKNKLDVAIFVGDPPDSAYRSLPLGSLTERFFASPSYLQQHGHPKDPRELSDHRWIKAQWQQPPISYSGRKSPNKILDVQVKVSASSNSLSGVTEMACKNMGVVFVPEISVAQEIGAGRLQHILKDYYGQKWPVHFLHPFQGERPRHVTRFYELMKRLFLRNNVRG